MTTTPIAGQGGPVKGDFFTVRVEGSSLHLELRRGEDNRVSLVKVGCLAASTRFDFAWRLACREQGVRTKPLGSSGTAERTVETFELFPQEQGSAVLRRAVQVVSLPHRQMVDLLIGKGEIAARNNEPAFADLGRNTPAAVLLQWVNNYYQANGIYDEESMRTITRNSRARFGPVPIENLNHNLHELYQIPTRVLAYSILMERGIRFPPPICHRRNWHLLEGYHRTAAHLAAGHSSVDCIIIGRA